MQKNYELLSFFPLAFLRLFHVRLDFLNDGERNGVVKRLHHVLVELDANHELVLQLSRLLQAADVAVVTDADFVGIRLVMKRQGRTRDFIFCHHLPQVSGQLSVQNVFMDKRKTDNQFLDADTVLKLQFVINVLFLINVLGIML